MGGSEKLSNDELARRLQREGFSRWSKGGHDRMYYNPFHSDDVKRKYKGNGRLDGGTLRDGTELWPSDIRKYSLRASLSKVYFDLNDRKIKGNDEEFKRMAMAHVKKVTKSRNGRSSQGSRGG